MQALATPRVNLLVAGARGRDRDHGCRCGAETSTSGDALGGCGTSVTVRALAPGASEELQDRVLDVARRRGMEAQRPDEDLDPWWGHLTGNGTSFRVEVATGHSGGVPLTVSPLLRRLLPPRWSAWSAP